MTLDEFLKNRKELIALFEAHWRKNAKKQPKDYPNDLDSLADWVEQLTAFDEIEHSCID